MNTLWFIILGGFLITVNYAAEKNNIPSIDLKPKSKIERSVIYYDRITKIGIDGIHTMEKDSIVYLKQKHGPTILRNKR